MHLLENNPASTVSDIVEGRFPHECLFISCELPCALSESVGISRAVLCSGCLRLLRLNLLAGLATLNLYQVRQACLLERSLPHS